MRWNPMCTIAWLIKAQVTGVCTCSHICGGVCESGSLIFVVVCKSGFKHAITQDMTLRILTPGCFFLGKLLSCVKC